MVDKIISGKGSAILSEVPEMIGAEHLLIRRMRNETVVQKFRRIMAWYINTANMLGVDMADNITPGNRAGGLINQCIKSLGAIAKGGTTAIEDVLDYGETLSQRGLNIMQGPGNDPESVTGIVAGGANIVSFSTGRGAVTGNAIVPVIKVSSTTELYEQMRDDIDFDAGSLLEASNPPPLGELGDLLVELVISVASGKRTKSEENGQREFQVWTAGKLSL
jgi:altronate hydrolase